MGGLFMFFPFCLIYFLELDVLVFEIDVERLADEVADIELALFDVFVPIVFAFFKVCEFGEKLHVATGEI